MVTGSTIKAAEMIHASQPMVSRLIGQLEAHLRLRLFERESSRLRPTPEAKAFFVEVERFYSGMNQLEKKATSLRDGRSGLLSIACLPALAYGPMPRFIAQLQKQLPNLAIQFDIRSSSEVRERVASGRCDLGFAAQEIDTAGIVARSIARRRALLAVPHGHPLSQKTRVQVRDLADYPYLSLSSTDSTQRKLNALVAETGSALQVVIETPYTLTIASLVAQGAGIGLIDPVALEAFEWPGVTLLEIEEDIHFNTLVIHSASSPLSSAGSLLIDIADEYLGNLKR